MMGKPIVVADTGSYEPHPAGQFRAVCVDVIELHGVPTQWGPKNKIRIVWQTEKKRADGKPFAAVRSFTASLNEKSNLRPFLEAWRGKRFTAEELKGFDLDRLVGANAILQVQHVERDGKIYDNVTSIMAPLKGMLPLAASEYVRKQDRPLSDDRNGSANNNSAGAPNYDEEPPVFMEDDDDLPF